MFLANACPNIFNALKSPIAICFDYRLAPKNLIPREKMS
jgi:hypothetical protein